jgi:hypothetical protein
MQLNTKFERTSKEREERPTPRVIKKNKKWAPLWAMVLDRDLLQPNPVFDDTRLLLQTARKTVQILEEAARVGCDCYYSRRMKRWVLYRDRKWELCSEARNAGLELIRIGNRDADYSYLKALVSEYSR